MKKIKIAAQLTSLSVVAALFIGCVVDKIADDDDNGGSNPKAVDCGSQMDDDDGGSSAATGAGAQFCERSWGVCSDGHSYGVSCMGAPGSWECECLFDGPVQSTFTSATMCELNTEQAATDEANAGCAWRLQP